MHVGGRLSTAGPQSELGSGGPIQEGGSRSLGGGMGGVRWGMTCWGISEGNPLPVRAS